MNNEKEKGDTGKIQVEIGKTEQFENWDAEDKEDNTTLEYRMRMKNKWITDGLEERWWDSEKKGEGAWWYLITDIYGRQDKITDGDEKSLKKDGIRRWKSKTRRYLSGNEINNITIVQAKGRIMDLRNVMRRVWIGKLLKTRVGTEVGPKMIWKKEDFKERMGVKSNRWSRLGWRPGCYPCMQGHLTNPPQVLKEAKEPG